MKAKKVSLWVIIFAVVWVLGLSLAKAFLPLAGRGELGLSMTEIVASGVFFVVAFTPVYRSIWLDKKFGLETLPAAEEGGTDGRCAQKSIGTPSAY